MPYYVAARLMALGFFLVMAAAHGGTDFGKSDTIEEGEANGRIEEDPAPVDG